MSLTLNETRVFLTDARPVNAKRRLHAVFFRSLLRFSAIVIIAVLHVARVAARYLVRTFSRFADACVCRTLFPAVHEMDVSRRLGNIHCAALIIAFRVSVPPFIRPRFERFAPARGARELAFVFYRRVLELEKNTLFPLH